jgi:hypothetical protein
VRELELANAAISEKRFGSEEARSWSDLAAISVRGVRLSRRDLEAVGKALSRGGRFLWLGGEERLREAGEWFAARRGFAAEGPKRLLPGSDARLLVVFRID